MRRYVATMVAIAFAALCIPGGFNALVDPNRMFQPLGLEVFDEQRLMLSRTGRGELLHGSDAEVVLIGSSRIIKGIDSAHPGFGGREVVNAGLKSGSIYEMSQALRLALSNGELEELILFVDFYAFNETLLTVGDFQSSRLNPEFNPVDYYLEKLFGMRSVYESYYVVKRARNSRRPKGPRNPGPGPRHRAYENVIGQFFSSPDLYGNYRYGLSRVDLFRDMVALALAAGVETTVVITPVHAALLETIQLAGLWETYETWKRDVLNAVDVAHRWVPGSPRPVFWDFTNYNEFTTEAIPPQSTGDCDQLWFSDPSHMRAALGNRVLDRVYGIESPSGSDGESYGEVLELASLDRHLARIRANRPLYLRQRPEDVDWLRRKAEDAPR